MILVGSGALVWRAADHAASAGKTVDAVIHPRGEVVPARAARFECVGTDDVNGVADVIDAVSSDRLVCSTGNPFIFREPVLELGLTIVNVHGAPLPGYRGLPVVAAAFAILRAEVEFGVTLHRVDAGIDTGAVIERRMFPMPADVTLEELSMAVTQACHDIFMANLGDLDRPPAPEGPPAVSGEYFGRKRLASIGDHRGNPNFARAIELGVLGDYYPEYADVFASARG
ncbi:formyltransferase family protein [Microbacterium sp. 18062]|uniref:formyltransferase family protein n=1 Tax=Microbacterium sp. 18062 TaxID=2681410 RepID=UPI001356C538|nr:formyltransferase family protein [Microbacterium sp. 18062]